MDHYRKRHHSFKESHRSPGQPVRRFSVCFGKRSLSVGRRTYDEPHISPLIDSDFRSENSVFMRPSCPAISLEKMSLDQDEGSPMSPDLLSDNLMHNHNGQRTTLYSMDFTHPLLQRGSVLSKSNHSSHGSDTSSAYSGSDTMQSVQSVSLDDQDVDLSGLVESIVDSDEEEELTESMESLTVRDTVRECLEKDPALRSDEDVGIILEYMQHLPAFANMTLTVRKALCSVMVFAVVEKPGVVVMNDGEELDSWSVIVNGAVEIESSNGEIRELQIGDSFGITPTMEKMYQHGIMRTKIEDCQFVCVAQNDYYRILHQGEESIKRHAENGKLIYITELRAVDATRNKAHVIIRGTPERLLAQLVEDNSMDVTYVEDFLLAYRTFIIDCKTIADKLLLWFDDPKYRDKVTRVVLLWVHNHFTDFETDVRMMEFLEQFEVKLEREKMLGQQRLLNIACATKARVRVITLARSTREEVLHFSILGGYETGFATFISKVDKGSKAEEVGLKRGDQILEVNGQSFEVMSHVRALELLRGTTHLCITVKSNLLAFKEMLSAPENTTRRCRKASEISLLQHDPRSRLSSQADWHETVGTPGSPTSKVGVSNFRPTSEGKKDEKKGYSTLGHRAKFRKVLAKMNIIPRTLNTESHLNSSDDSLYSINSSSSGGSGNYSGRGSSPQPCTGGSSGTLYHSHSNPDLTSLTPSEELRLEFPEHVLKIYRSDQTYKYLLVHKETTAREVVMLSLREFGITESSSKYCLCEVSVGESGVVKQRRLPDPQQNLAERISLSSRYYLKNNMSSDSLVPDELAVELLRESQVHLLHLNSVELATQLTIEDFSIFRQIEPTEYVDELFEVHSRYGMPMLSKFVELVNREMFWVVTEVCFEHNLYRRMRIIKQFIKVARQCKECKNFNSMFAIISGLGHGAVSRLRLTWEKLPSKYTKLFEDLQDFMDPSRNMYKYRNLLNSDHIQPPMIPFYPVLKKDLTFIHLGNDSIIEGLINFEKLRMVAKEIRTVVSMCSAPYDLFNMLESGGAHPTAAMASLNSFATTTNAATVKRRKKSTAQPNPKKMFEEAQMVRRVKAYLNNLKVVTDEDQLHSMSVECEPLITSGGITTLQVRKRQPSPTLSASSSNSSSSDIKKGCNSSKFGSDSPQAVRKLLALSDQNKVRPHQPLRPPVSDSPSLSPVTGRRLHDPRPSFAAEMGSITVPVDLYPESSSVTSFSAASIKKSQTSGSVTSSDSYHLQHYDNDSGICSASFDSRSNSSAGSTSSPPHLKRHASGPSGSYNMKKFSE